MRDTFNTLNASGILSQGLKKSTKNFPLFLTMALSYVLDCILPSLYLSIELGLEDLIENLLKKWPRDKPFLFEVISSYWGLLPP